MTSRGIGLLKRVLTDIYRTESRQPHRHSGTWTYRQLGPPPAKHYIRLAQIIGGFTMWWILWHLWHDYELIIGEFDYPDPRKWTDEELGIPPDDKELGIPPDDEDISPIATNSKNDAPCEADRINKTNDTTNEDQNVSPGDDEDIRGLIATTDV